MKLGKIDLGHSWMRYFKHWVNSDSITKQDKIVEHLCKHACVRRDHCVVCAGYYANSPIALKKVWAIGQIGRLL